MASRDLYIIKAAIREVVISSQNCGNLSDHRQVIEIKVIIVGGKYVM